MEEQHMLVYKHRAVYKLTINIYSSEPKKVCKFVHEESLSLLSPPASCTCYMLTYKILCLPGCFK